jgi:hypothetical protein
MIYLAFSPREHRWRLLAAALLILLLITHFFSRNAVRIYRSESQFLAAMQREGFARVGRIGRADWPAITVRRDLGEGGVRFVDGRGQGHEYKGFDGAVRAVTLRPLRGLRTRPEAFVQVFARQRPSAGY